MLFILTVKVKGAAFVSSVLKTVTFEKSQYFYTDQKNKLVQIIKEIDYKFLQVKHMTRISSTKNKHK